MKQTKSALKWIVGILERHKVPFQVTGGLAAEMYGSRRELADIDLEIPENDFLPILKDVKRHIIFGPKRLKDKNWDIFLMTLEYGDQKIDLAGAYSELIRGEKRKRWVLQNTHFDEGPVKKIYGIRVHVARKKDLVAYKKELGRPVDKIDVKEIS